jgi:DNA-damage-inducible protein J
MPAEAIIETHIDASLKQQAEAIFAEAGTTIDQVLREVLEKSVANHSVPYGIFGPNAETRAAMDELRNGGGKKFDTVADLMAHLNADD